MKRTISTLIVVALLTASSLARQSGQAGPVTDKEWQNLLAAVSGEDWDTSVRFSADYLKRMKEDADDWRLPRLRYIYLYSAAGEVSLGRMSFDELERTVKEFAGKEAALPYRRIARECRGALNVICQSGEKSKLIVAATNKAGTYIHAFEYVTLKEGFDVSAHDGEQASIVGVIDSVVPNPNHSRAIVMRIYVRDGVVQLRNEKP